MSNDERALNRIMGKGGRVRGGEGGGREREVQELRVVSNTEAGIEGGIEGGIEVDGSTAWTRPHFLGRPQCGHPIHLTYQ